MRSGAQPIHRDAGAFGRAAHAGDQDCREQGMDEQPATEQPRRRWPIDQRTTTARWSQRRSPRHRRERARPSREVTTRQRPIATAQPRTMPPSSRPLARVSVPMYTRVGSAGLNKRYIKSSDTTEVATQNDDHRAVHVAAAPGDQADDHGPHQVELLFDRQAPEMAEHARQFERRPVVAVTGDGMPIGEVGLRPWPVAQRRCAFRHARHDRSRSR